MPAKLHPADAAAARIIGRASRFEIALFRGQGRYAKADAATLTEALKAATRLEAEIANGRTAMIYAITTEGRSALVTPATLQAMETNPMQPTYSTKFNARRAAEKAGTPGDRIEVIKARTAIPGARRRERAPPPRRSPPPSRPPLPTWRR